MKKIWMFGIGFIVWMLGLGLSACGNWKPEVSGTGAVSGSAASDPVEKAEPVKEPTLAEVQEAFQFAIGQEIYLFGGDTRDGFTGKELAIYRKEGAHTITYFLVDCTDRKEHWYDADRLIFNKACEEPGFESFVEQFSYYSEKEKKNGLKGAKKLGTVDAWKFSAHQKPDYREMTRGTKKIVERLKQRIEEDVKANLIRSQETTYHAYIQYFTPADQTALVYLAKEGENEAYVLWYTLGESMQLDPEEYSNRQEVWQGSEKTEDAGLLSRAVKGAMAVSDVHVPATKISDLGLSKEVTGQLETMNKNRKTWLTCFNAGDEDEGLDEIYSNNRQYMISDLNQNGRLEVVRILPYGAGGFMETAVFEVSEDGESLVTYKNNEENPMELGGPGVMETDCYFDKKAEIYYYTSENETNANGWEFGNAPGRFYLKGDAYKEDYMEAYRTIRKRDEKITYRRGEKKISKSEYERIEKQFWQGLEKKKATFYWQLADDLTDLSDADTLLALAGSWKGFSINDIKK